MRRESKTSKPAERGRSKSQGSVKLSVPCVPAAPPRNRTATSQPRPRKFRCDRSTVPTKLSADRSEEHTSELQSRGHLVCRLLLEKKKKKTRLPAPHLSLLSSLSPSRPRPPRALPSFPTRRSSDLGAVEEPGLGEAQRPLRPGRPAPEPHRDLPAAAEEVPLRQVDGADEAVGRQIGRAHV